MGGGNTVSERMEVTALALDGNVQVFREIGADHISHPAHPENAVSFKQSDVPFKR